MAKKSRSTRKVNRTKVRGRAEHRHNSQGGGLNTLALPEGVELFSAKKGRNAFDILPYEVSVTHHPEVKKGELWYQRTFWIHRDVGPEEKMVICPLKTIGKACPICEEYNRMKKDPDADEDMVKALKPKEREIFNVLDKGKDGSGEVQIFESSFHTFGNVLEEELTEGDEANACFADLEGGKTLRVRFNEKSMGQYSFLTAGRIDFVDRREDYDEDMLDTVFDLDKLLKIMDYDEISTILMGDGPINDDEDEDEQDEIPDGCVECAACQGSGKNSKGRKCPICKGNGYVPEPDEDEDDDDEDEEPKKKAKKKSSRTRKPDPEDEDDNDDEDDDPDTPEDDDEDDDDDDW